MDPRFEKTGGGGGGGGGWGGGMLGSKCCSLAHRLTYLYIFPGLS